MSVLLIMTPLVRKYDDRRLQPLGIAYIASYLENKGIKCDILDANYDIPSTSIEEIVDKVITGNYEIVGLSVTTPAFENAIKIAEEIKKRKSIKIVLGGHHPTHTHREILEKFKCVDVAIRGEGEISFFELVKAKNEGLSLEDINGITYRDDDGNVIINTDRPLLNKIDELPFPKRNTLPYDYSYFTSEDGVILYDIPVVSSRGCPYECAFCAAQSFYGNISPSKKWRPREPKQVATEIKSIVDRYKDVFIRFTDDNFLIDIKRAIEMAHEIQRQCKKNIKFSFATRVEQILAAGEDNLKNLALLGCTAIEVGIENGSNVVLSRFCKGLTIEKSEKALKMVKNAGINLGIDYIMFDPETTVSEIKENIDYLKRNSLYGYYPPLMYSRIVAYPGTPFAAKGEIDYENYFVSKDVEKIYRVIEFFQKNYQLRIDNLVKKINSNCREICSDSQRMIDEISIICLPYKLLEGLIQNNTYEIPSISNLPMIKKINERIEAIEERYYID